MYNKFKPLYALIMATVCSMGNASTDTTIQTPLMPVNNNAIAGMPSEWKSFPTPKVFKVDFTALLDLNAGDAATLNLPEGKVTYVTRSKSVQNGEVVWIGQFSETGSLAQAQIHFTRKGTIFGQIQTLRDTYDIDTAHDSTWLLSHALSDIKHPTIDNDNDIAHESGTFGAGMDALSIPLGGAMGLSASGSVAPAAEGPVLASPDDETLATIDVMALYTDDLTKDSVDKYLHKQIVYANQAYINSHINIRLRLVHVEPFHPSAPTQFPSYEKMLLDGSINAGWLERWLTGGKEAAITDLRDRITQKLKDTCGFYNLPGCSDPITFTNQAVEQFVATEESNHPVPSEFKNIGSTRHQYGADLVLVVYQASGSQCGATYTTAPPTHYVNFFDSTYMVATVNTDSTCGTALDTVAHEIGHSLGSGHYFGDSPSRFMYSNGYHQDNWATIMKPTVGEGVLPYFSNPRISVCNGAPCGNVETADDARAFNEVRFLVANLFPSTVPNDGTDGTVQQDDTNNPPVVATPNLCSKLLPEDSFTVNINNVADAKQKLRMFQVARLKCTARLNSYKISETKRIRKETRGNLEQRRARKAEMKANIARAKQKFILPTKKRIVEIKAKLKINGYPAT